MREPVTTTSVSGAGSALIATGCDGPVAGPVCADAPGETAAIIATSDEPSSKRVVKHVMFIPLNNLRGTLSVRAAKDPPQRVERRNEKVGRCKCVEIDGDGRYRRFRPGHQSVGDSRLRAMTPAVQSRPPVDTTTSPTRPTPAIEASLSMGIAHTSAARAC
jgi:hypothetical protein